jgi:type IV secretory pathway protease TraF
MMKRVAGVAGQRVCRTGRTISVDGIDIAEALERDRLSRILPVWQGCRVLAVGEIFLMNSQVRDSLDGRYFGPVSVGAIIGRATPLYTDEDGNGRFEWRALRR